MTPTLLNTNVNSDSVIYEKSKRLVIASECCGEVSSVMINDSAIIILFASMMGMDDVFSMITTSLRGLSLCLMLIPCAYLSIKLGYKRSIQISALLSCVMFLLLSASPIFGTAGKLVAMSAAFAYTLSYPLYVSAYFPLVEGLVPQADRGSFLGLNRFCWMMTAAIFIFLSGCIIGNSSVLWPLQVVITVAGLLCIGKAVLIGMVPNEETVRANVSEFRKALFLAITNVPLRKFSFYLFFLYLSAYSSVPLGFMYLKTFQIGDKFLVIVSAFTMFGALCGYLAVGRLLNKLGTRRMLKYLSILLAVSNILLFFCAKTFPGSPVFISVLLTLYGGLIAAAVIAGDTEMMMLASPGNKVMSMAFCGTIYFFCMGASRILYSLLAGENFIPHEWCIWSLPVSHFQILFLAAGVVTFLTCFHSRKLIPEFGRYF